MSRSLSHILVIAGALLTVGGCVNAPPPAQVVVNPAPELVIESPTEHLLKLHAAVAQMTAEQVDNALAGMAKPAVARDRFYLGLLHQQAASYGNSIQARDIFRELRESENLTASERQLASILEEFNQNRINARERHRLLQEQYTELQQLQADTEQQKILLEQKIQAITDLEAAISTRKEKEP